MKTTGKRQMGVALALAGIGLIFTGSRALAQSQGGSFALQVEPSAGCPVPQGPLDTGEPTDIALTASVLNPPSGYWYSPCQLNGPYWTQDPVNNTPTSWSIQVQYSQSDPTTFGTPQAGTFSSDVYQASVSAADATLEFFGLVGGYWSITATANVYYNDGACGDTWFGSAFLALPPITVQNAPPPFTVEAMPNSPIALRNEYVGQADPVEVLQGWQVRLTAPAGVANVTWWWQSAVGGPFQLGVGSPLVYTVGTLHSPQMWYTGTVGGVPQTSATRTITEGGVVSPAGAAGFNLTSAGNYTKTGFAVSFTPQAISPIDFALTMSGEVDLQAGSPALTKFQWGFVQSVQGTWNIATTAISITWNPNSMAGAMLTFPSGATTQPLPNPPLLNDAAPGRQLYGTPPPKGIAGGFSAPTALNMQSSAGDTPGLVPATSVPFMDSSFILDTVNYAVVSDNNVSLTFNVWLVVFNVATQQYVPLRQWPWTLAWNTTAWPGPPALGVVATPAPAELAAR